MIGVQNQTQALNACRHYDMHLITNIPRSSPWKMLESQPFIAHLSKKILFFLSCFYALFQFTQCSQCSQCSQRRSKEVVGNDVQTKMQNHKLGRIIPVHIKWTIYASIANCMIPKNGQKMNSSTLREVCGWLQVHPFLVSGALLFSNCMGTCKT